jgi:V8-like Glu-specific endopeptidase
MWNKRLTQLNDALSTMIFTFEGAVPYLTAAGINPGMIDSGGNALTIWNNIISYANNNNQLTELVDALLAKYPKNPHLLAFKEAIEKDYSMGPDIKTTDWKESLDEEGLEKITGDASTLLPISFLQVGLDRARSVARVFIRRGNRAEVGTGFLLANNLFLTNNHVIGGSDTALITKIQFDFEQSVTGNPLQMTEFDLDPAKGFATSKEDDWTIIRIKGDANTKFGAITPGSADVKKGDFVNIIQHPAGGFKQIGMYHNMVTFADTRIVQYLTDTEPGSSGSPVFNSQWNLVALHHSGGMLMEPGTSQRLLRNEGININKVMAGIKAANL